MSDHDGLDEVITMRGMRSQCRGVNCRAEELEGMFVEHLKAIEPQPETAALLTAIVKDLVLQRTEESRKDIRRLNGEVEQLEHRKTQALEAFLYRKEIDRETYERECARLKSQIETKRQQVSAISTPELSERVVEGLGQLLTDASGRWRDFPAALRRRFQGVMFPEGMTFADGRFGTPKMCPFMGLNGTNPSTLNAMASPAGCEHSWTREIPGKVKAA